MRLLYSNNGLTFRDVTPVELDPRDVSSDGAPAPGLVAQSAPIVAEPGEVEFDHAPTEQELLEAFPGRAVALEDAARAQANAPILAELRELDAFLPRAVEDQWNATAFDTTTLPFAQRERLAHKQALRASLA